jgi:tetratricopeptide (TPR) repeat protein
MEIDAITHAKRLLATDAEASRVQAFEIINKAICTTASPDSEESHHLRSFRATMYYHAGQIDNFTTDCNFVISHGGVKFLPKKIVAMLRKQKITLDLQETELAAVTMREPSRHKVIDPFTDLRGQFTNSLARHDYPEAARLLVRACELQTFDHFPIESMFAHARDEKNIELSFEDRVKILGEHLCLTNDKFSNHAAYYCALGYTYNAGQFVHSAKEALEKGHAANPHHVPIIFALYRLYRKNNSPKALHMAERLHQIVPDSVQYSLLLASMYSRFNRTQDVINLLKPIATDNSSNKNVVIALTYTYLKATDFDAAHNLLIGLRDSPTSKRLKLVIYFLQKRDREALRLATDIVQEGSVDLRSAGIFVVLRSQADQNIEDWCFKVFRDLGLDGQTLDAIRMTTQNIRESRERILDDIFDVSLKRRVCVSPVYKDPTRKPCNRAAAAGLYYPQRAP